MPIYLPNANRRLMRKPAGCFARFTVSLASMILLFLCLPRSGSSQELNTQQLKPFFDKHCNDCHSAGAKEGNLSIQELNSELGDVAAFAKWERLYDRVSNGEMPPTDADQPGEKERLAFLQVLGESLTKAHAARKGVVFRRLNRREYQNTMNDLFGVQLDLESTLPEDGRAHEFDNVGSALSISMVQLKRYLEAADAVMDAAIAKTTEPPPLKKIHTDYAQTREGERFIGKLWRKLDDGAVVFFKSGGYPSGMLRTANTRVSGLYRIRVTGYSYQSDKPVTFAVGATTFQPGAEKPTFGYFSFPVGKPTTIELEAWIERNYMIDLTPWGINDQGNAIRKNGLKSYQGPGLAILHVDLEGPILDAFPSRGHRLLFDGLDRREVEPNNPSVKKKSWYVPKFEIKTGNAAEDARKSLLRIATTAFRRPVEDGELKRYVDLFKDQMAKGLPFETALKTAAAAIFCSPDFLYLREREGWLDDYEIASRLSYFLTRTTPDPELLSVAKSGRLSRDPEVLKQQTRRLLDDPRHARFIADFTDAWLNLRDIEFTSPDRNLYPEFDRFLQYSMLQETRQFVDSLFQENASIGNVVKSDFGMLNNRLAEHYGIAGITHSDLRKVVLPQGSVRGGLLSQASILKVSANGTNTSPVVRGVWVMERIMGQSPPPPPPGIPGVEPDIRGASTLRELLDKHRNVDSCRSCHMMIDPPGFALECFNPIGGWRDRFRSLGEGERVQHEVNGRAVRYRIGPAVDSSGELASGEKFASFLQFRDLLARDQDALARTVAKKLLTFATGRELGFSDRATIDRIVEQSNAKRHGMRDLLELVVLSPAFRRK